MLIFLSKRVSNYKTGADGQRARIRTMYYSLDSRVLRFLKGIGGLPWPKLINLASCSVKKTGHWRNGHGRGCGALFHVGKETEEEILPFEKQPLHQASRRPEAGPRPIPRSRGWFSEVNSPPCVRGAPQVPAQLESLPAHSMSGFGDTASPPRKG